MVVSFKGVRKSQKSILVSLRVFRTNQNATIFSRQEITRTLSVVSQG